MVASPSKRMAVPTAAVAQAARRPRRCTSKTGVTSVGELRSRAGISASAVCLLQSLREAAFLAWSSVSSRAFSMAMAAWSAKVSNRAI
jgi:hypothetical protein